jgi:hypothetical protein
MFKRSYELLVKLFKSGKTFKYVLAFPLLALPVLLMWEHIISKFAAYYQETDLTEFLRINLFFGLAMWYSKNKLETVLLFFPIFVLVYLFGGDRINFLGYFIFLYYGLQYRRGWNFGVLATSGYFAYATLGFCLNVLGVEV